MTIRPYQSADYAALMRICLETAADGADGTALFSDPELPGLVYAGPYLLFEPQLCFVVEDDSGRPAGYVLGCSDTDAFCAWLENLWYPPLRAKFPLPGIEDETPEADIIRRIHTGRPPLSDFFEYRAHLHIDLLPRVQRRGHGRRLVDLFCRACAEKGVGGVRLGVDTSNESAVAFYLKTGFEVLVDHGSWLQMGRRTIVV